MIPVMKLVMLTNSYPYGDQEAFIEPEIRSFEKEFEEIHIYTLALPNSSITRYVPENARVIQVCKSRYNGQLIAMLNTINPLSWKEIFFVKKAYNYSFRSAISLLLNFYGKAPYLFMKYLETEDRTDTIFYSYWLSHLAYTLSLFKKKNSDVFCISRAHRVDNFIDFKASLYRREIISSLNGIFPISLEGKKELETKVLPYIDSNHADIKVFHLGVDFSDIINPTKEKESMKIVSCSFIHHIKRLDIIINALEQIEDIPIEWIHFGGGQDEQMIKDMANKKIGNKKNITYVIKGQTDHSVILDYYNLHHVDLFINCIDHEGIPVSIMEAMATGIVCCARDVGGNRELITNNESGFLLEKNAGADEYAQLILKLNCMNEKDLASIRTNAMKKVRKEFASPDVYESFASYLKKAYEATKKE